MARKIPISVLPLLVYKLRTGGLGWARERLRQEWEMPRTAPGRVLYRGRRGLRRSLAGDEASAGATGPADILYAFYDLAVSPITFDFLWFLVGAELARRRAALAGIHVVIVPGREDGVRREDSAYEAVVDPSARRARIVNMLVPACAFLPSVAATTVAASRLEAERLVAFAAGRVFPERYEPAMPVTAGSREPLRAAREEGAELGVLRAAPADLQSVERWLAARGLGRRIVTITLRHYAYMSDRNSNEAAWLAFARRLDRALYDPVFVPDTGQVFERLPRELGEFAVFPEAAVNLGLRMALYERAFLNLGVNSGPLGLCWLNARAAYITFKLLTESVPQTTPEYMRSLGFEIGGSLPGAKPWQKWVWESDDLPVIEREFAAMAAVLAAHPPQPPA